jgi:hypothetical protein
MGCHTRWAGVAMGRSVAPGTVQQAMTCTMPVGHHWNWPVWLCYPFDFLMKFKSTTSSKICTSLNSSQKIVKQISLGISEKPSGQLLDLIVMSH